MSQTYLTFTSLHQVKLKQMKMIEYECLMSKVFHLPLTSMLKELYLQHTCGASTAKFYIVISGQQKMNRSLSFKQLSILIWKIIIYSICKDFYIEKKINENTIKVGNLWIFQLKMQCGAMGATLSERYKIKAR